MINKKSDRYDQICPAQVKLIKGHVTRVKSGVTDWIKGKISVQDQGYHGAVVYNGNLSLLDFFRFYLV